MLIRGHVREYLIEHKNLHRWCNTDSEAHNGFLKNYMGHRSQNNGHKGGLHNASMTSGEQVETNAKCLLRMYLRRIMWLLDPDVLNRLPAQKTAKGYKKRDIVTVSRRGYSPKSFVEDSQLLHSLYDHCLSDVV